MALIIKKIMRKIGLLYARRPVMKVSIFISVVAHVVMLLALRNAFPLYWPEELRSYKVDFIRLPVDDMKTGDLPDTQVDPVRQKEKSASDQTQDTISLDTKDKRYMPYAGIIKGEIMRRWKYPPEARAYLIQGVLKVLFTLSREGGMTEIHITETSGHDILDHEVLRAINQAAPFPPFPETITVKRLNIVARFDYRLETGKGY
jgi:TonB family protein